MTKHDIEAIRHLIARQFNSMCWTPNNSAAWKAFAADFAPRAALYPAARPARSQTVEKFRGAHEGSCGNITLHVLRGSLRRPADAFGNVAVAAAGCEMTDEK